MKTRQFRLCDGVFVELQCGSLANTGSGVLWTEMTYTEAAEILVDAQRLEIDKELLEFFVSADASFISTESDALLQLSTRTVSLEGERLRYASLIVHVTECEIRTVESASSGIGELVRAGWPFRAAVHGVQPWHILAVSLTNLPRATCLSLNQWRTRSCTWKSIWLNHP